MTDHLEAFNRATHSDALREMQYVDPEPVRAGKVVQSLFNTEDFFVSIATAVLIVIVIPFGLLVLMAL